MAKIDLADQPFVLKGGLEEIIVCGGDKLGHGSAG
jgi:hypothetical protein